MSYIIFLNTARAIFCKCAVLWHKGAIILQTKENMNGFLKVFDYIC